MLCVFMFLFQSVIGLHQKKKHQESFAYLLYGTLRGALQFVGISKVQCSV